MDQSMESIKSLITNIGESRTKIVNWREFIMGDGGFTDWVGKVKFGWL
jgi:hypothetical protein